MMSSRVDVNSEIVRQCREQIGMSLEDACKKVSSIEKIEKGEEKPTFKQLDTLSSLYNVPRWVFIAEELPEAHRFDKMPAFRKFKQGAVFNERGVRSVLVCAEQLRDLMLEFREDQNEPISDFPHPFEPPSLEDDPQYLAELTREWLGVGDKHFAFQEWRQYVETKDIFVFMTDKYRGWSHVNWSYDEVSFRGFTVYHPSLPMIVINDSDARKAQSFTLLHELAHVLRQETAIDDTARPSQEVEKWCDMFAGCVLMPEEAFRKRAEALGIRNSPHLELKHIEKLAEPFRVSSFACLVRAGQLKIINAGDYRRLEKEIKRGREEGGGAWGPPRQRNSEAIHQYGKLFLRTATQAYYDQEIGLHKLCKIFRLSQPDYVMKILEKFK